MNHSAFHRSSSHEPLSPGRYRVRLQEDLELPRKPMIGSYVVQPVRMMKKNHCSIRLAQARGGFHERVEHRLELERRATDDLEHVGGCGLLL